ncbi:ribosomal-processing cysteine protease Prp [Alkaliphilus serpentinus]|uniref:Ribosomal processing cysteine protease Prp n=1 Tax=Alkaliphilus serpentinus TaxID=1482731 RepID=A0A833MEJ9_9FIRM|nr:ribosomal-processing cysteine protease Prp [Alkaliphilus serpentinus]KAB3531429.1 ribosomal-processing cysteine protease Prp [Alkaliphilus serpentinus]
MIKIVIKRNENGNISEFDIKGHASSAKAGEDIVCAAVSVLSQTTLLGLYEILKIELDHQREKGDIYCRIPDNLPQSKREDANILLETMVLGLKSLVIGYPKYIELHDKEV